MSNIVEPLNVDTKVRNKNRTMLYCVMLLPLLTVGASYFIYKTGIGLPEGTKNKGSLVIPPQQINELSLTTAEDSTFSYSDKTIWSFIIPQRGVCEQKCKDRLHITKQAHILLGKNARALQRFYLNLDGELNAELGSFLEKEHPKLTVLNGSEIEFTELLKTAYEDQRPAFFLVDPQGFIMMHYTDDHIGKDVLKDLKFLISGAGGH